jgi:undecaprenyl diphosphate synthase
MSTVGAPKQDETPSPRHVAIIMDGNRRWAKARALPRALGHREGVRAVREIVRAASDLRIQILTLYSFSSENWKRPPEEIEYLMGLLRWYLREDLAELHQNGVKIRIIGSRAEVAPDIVDMIAEAEALTKNNDKLLLIIAFNYGGQDEIVKAAREIAEDVAQGKLKPSEITKETIAGRLETSGLPDPDLIIRTSGEKRLSNFLIWQSAYAEFMFVDTFWPDFTKQHLEEAIAEYRRRERRYGAN